MSQLTTAEDEPRRATRRRRVVLGGRLVFGPFTVACRLKNVSATGAQVIVPGDIHMPDRLYLLVVSSGCAHEATVVWRRGDLVGLVFSGALDLTDPTVPDTHGLKRIWAAIAPEAAAMSGQPAPNASDGIVSPNDFQPPWGALAGGEQ